jgi:uncharacterized protein YjdB/sugar lactone lactonase YvrE
MKRVFVRLVAALGVVACFLPGEPSGADRIEFQLEFALPYRVPLAGTAEPTVRITAEGQPLRNPPYRLESLDEGVLRVDRTDRGLEGVARGTADVRVIYQTATGTPDTVFPVQVVVSRIAVGAPVTTLPRLGATTQLVATAYDAQDAPVPDVAFTWSSADPQVATVNDAGLVRAVNEGTVTIGAEADNVQGLASLTVAQAAGQVFVAPELDTVRTIGRSVQFIAVALDSARQVLQGARAYWTSSDTTVVRVDAAGVASAVAGGTAQIIARVGQAADTATLVVAQVVRFLSVTPGSDTLTAIADTGRLTVLAFDSLRFPIPSPSVGWATSDAAVATVDQAGLVRAERNGVVLVTASAAGQSASVTVLVRQDVVAARIEEDNATLTGAGATVGLSGAGLDRNGYPVSGAVFTWRSASQCVASVDGTGVVTAVGGGETIITATPANGGQSDTVTVTVAGAPGGEPEIAFGGAGIEAVCSDGTGRHVLATYGEAPSWSRDGARLAFVASESYGVVDYPPNHAGESVYCTDIYTARADFSNQQRVTQNRIFYIEGWDVWACEHGFYNPAWSPDGTKIAMVLSDVDGNSDIMVVNTDGSNIKRLNWPSLQPNRDVFGGTPTWSPDGTKLAFFAGSYPSNPTTIYVVNTDATNARALWSAPGIDGSTSYGLGIAMGPAWSPDGTHLAVIFNRDIWLVNADGSAATNLHSSAGLSGPPVDAATPAWSPDGTRLVFSMRTEAEADAGFGFNIWVINRDGTGRQRLTSPPPHVHNFHPSWRPTAPVPNVSGLGTARTGSR